MQHNLYFDYKYKYKHMLTDVKHVAGPLFFEKYETNFYDLSGMRRYSRNKNDIKSRKMTNGDYSFQNIQNHYFLKVRLSMLQTSAHST